MSPDQLTAMIQALGYPVCVSVAMFAVNWLLMKRYFAASDKLVDHTARVVDLTDQTNRALKENTSSNGTLTKAVQDLSSKFGSDPSKTICQAPSVSHCKADQVAAALAEFERRGMKPIVGQ